MSFESIIAYQRLHASKKKDMMLDLAPSSPISTSYAVTPEKLLLLNEHECVEAREDMNCHADISKAI